MNNGSRPTFRFENLGPIKEAELELGDLTIIAGRNNTGKTYVAYALYGFLDYWRACSAPEPIRRGSSRSTNSLLMEASKTGMLKLPTDQETLQRRRTKLIKQIARDYSELELRSVFNADAEAFENASFTIQPGSHPGIDNLEQLENPRLSIAHEDGAWIISPNDSEPRLIRNAYSLTAFYLSIAFPEFSLDPFILTSERFGISLFHRELDLAKNELVRELQQMASNDGKKYKERDTNIFIMRMSSRYAHPIHDNINFTRYIPDWADQKSELYEQKRHDDIKRMMQGYFRVENGGVRFVSTARKEKRFNLPLYRASSSARGLSDMYFYMRHVAQEGQLLMVDEPEAHLDTANQIEMARLLARLVRAGVKVFITTHSDYIVKEFNNLIMLGRDFRDKERVAKKYGYDEGECLDANQVRGYIAEKNGLKLCDMNDYGIDYPNFDETINNVNRRARAFAEHVWAERKK